MNDVGTKKIIDICKNYYDIINEKFPKDDEFSKMILNSYKNAVETINFEDYDLVKRLMILDESVYTYFNDEKFKNIVVNELDSLTDNTNDFIVSKYISYKQENKIVTTKWI